jgi:hypothetical protein
VPGVAKIAAMAPREGRGLNLGAEKASLVDGLTKGMKDAANKVWKGRSELDILHGEDNGPRSWLDLQFGLHDAMKAPAERAEYTRSFLKRIDDAVAKGEDVTSPEAILRHSAAAYVDAKAAKGKKKAEQGAGDQGLMFGFACDETPELMPTPIMFAHRLGRELTRIRKAGKRAKWLRPDAKSQVSVVYEDDKPVSISNVVISTQHASDVEHAEI